MHRILLLLIEEITEKALIGPDIIRVKVKKVNGMIEEKEVDASYFKGNMHDVRGAGIEEVATKDIDMIDHETCHVVGGQIGDNYHG